jgi:hypothetical protein
MFSFPRRVVRRECRIHGINEIQGLWQALPQSLHQLLHFSLSLELVVACTMDSQAHRDFSNDVEQGAGDIGESEKVGLLVEDIPFDTPDRQPACPCPHCASCQHDSSFKRFRYTLILYTIVAVVLVIFLGTFSLKRSDPSIQLYCTSHFLHICLFAHSFLSTCPRPR